MKISKPEKYANILIEEMIHIVKVASNNLFYENYHNICSPFVSSQKFEDEMKKVEELKLEILDICAQTLGDKQ